MWLLAAFIGIPLIEIALFVQVGGLLGLWPTLLIVVLTAIAGAALVRSQGIVALANIQRSLDRFDNPAAPLAHGAMIGGGSPCIQPRLVPMDPILAVVRGGPA